jgi:hypothetical protein
MAIPRITLRYLHWRSRSSRPTLGSLARASSLKKPVPFTYAVPPAA